MSIHVKELYEVPNNIVFGLYINGKIAGVKEIANVDRNRDIVEKFKGIVDFCGIIEKSNNAQRLFLLKKSLDELKTVPYHAISELGFHSTISFSEDADINPGFLLTLDNILELMIKNIKNL